MERETSLPERGARGRQVYQALLLCWCTVSRTINPSACVSHGCACAVVLLFFVSPYCSSLYQDAAHSGIIDT
jgi:hypothetical protein